MNTHTTGLDQESASEKRLPGLDDRLKAQYTTWTFKPGYNAQDLTLGQVQKDLEGKTSILALIKGYLDELKIIADNDAPQFAKLAKLFEMGKDLDGLEGRFFGVPTGLRTGDQKGPFAEFGNVIGLIWGVTLEDECPWVGKTFSPADSARWMAVTGSIAPASSKSYLGINHFRKMDFRVLNTVSFNVLNWWLSLENAPAADPGQPIGEKLGGHFVASQAHSVYAGSDRQVLQLNYRWKNLGNRPPLSWLIDEMVQIAGGLYLGQLLFATRHLLNDFDPQRPVAENSYEHFGFFVLFDRAWHPEAQLLFPYLSLSPAQPGATQPPPTVRVTLPKFTSFTFDQPLLPICRDDLYAQATADMQDKPTILHLLKEYADKLETGFDNHSPYFLRLQEIFNRGIGIRELRGFYRGALISWHSEGLFKVFHVNTLNLGWVGFIRQFSTWTGKSFEDISPARLQEITDGFEPGAQPTFWGANTQSLRSSHRRFVGQLMKMAEVWIEPVPPAEAQRCGYDLKNFFFIAHQAKSVNPANQDKTIFQFNYRWPKLKTIIPNRYCLDELVQIADGLYLGQLMYATAIVPPYDPRTDPAEYQYRQFGYFLLMDEEWHRLRLKIGFDLANT